MAELEIRVRVNPRTGKGRVVGSSRAGGAGGDGAALPPAQGAAAQGNMARAITGSTASGYQGGRIPWFMDPSDPMGSGLRNVLAAALDPHRSGASIDATVGAQGLRAGAAATGLALNKASLGAIPVEIGNAVADALAEGFDRIMARDVATNEGANRAVGGVAAQFARAGFDLPDDVLREAFQRERAAQGRAYDARSRVAGVSGNRLAGGVVDAQTAAGAARERISGLLDDMGVGMIPGVKKAVNNQVDDMRRQAEQAARMNQAAVGPPTGR